MGKSRFKISVQIVFAFLLLVVSFWMLLQPWTEITVEIKGKEYTVSGLLKYMGSYMDMSEKEMRAFIEESVQEAVWGLEDGLDIDLKAKAGITAIKNLMDGELTLLDLSSTVTWFANFLKTLEEVYTDLVSVLPGFELPDAEDFAMGAMAVNIASAALWGFYGLIAFSFLFALYSLFTGKNAGVIVYTVLVALPVTGFVAAVLLGNRALAEAERGFRDWLNQILVLYEYEFTARVNLEILKLTLYPFVCFLSPVCALLILAIPEPQRSVSTRKKTVKAPVNQYTNRLENRVAEVPVFGNVAVQEKTVETVQAETARCACGAEIKPGAVFCVYCGRSLKANLWTCPVCGTESSIVNRFCSVCGTKRPEKKLCECGAELNGEAAFCPNCGKKIEK